MNSSSNISLFLYFFSLTLIDIFFYIGIIIITNRSQNKAYLYKKF